MGVPWRVRGKEWDRPQFGWHAGRRHAAATVRVFAERHRAGIELARGGCGIFITISFQPGRCILEQRESASSNRAWTQLRHEFRIACS